uniref:Uncharacterized protein n=1 Tax=Glossina pallidipes TaxID=7398 RepID=A0A1B0AGE2_GLOPL
MIIGTTTTATNTEHSFIVIHNHGDTRKSSGNLNIVISCRQILLIVFLRLPVETFVLDVILMVLFSNFPADTDPAPAPTGGGGPPPPPPAPLSIGTTFALFIPKCAAIKSNADSIAVPNAVSEYHHNPNIHRCFKCVLIQCKLVFRSRCMYVK